MMKFAKRSLLFALALFLCLCLFLTLTATQASAEDAKRTGWYQLGNDWRYYDENGELHTGWLHLGNKWYYFNSNGNMNTLSSLQIDSIIHLFDEDGVWIKELRNCWYHAAQDERYHYWEGWYYYNENGKCHSGWLFQDGNWYYCMPSYGYRCTGRMKIDNAVYVFDQNGILISTEKNRWENTDGKWRYYDAFKQEYLTGKQHIGEHYYLFDSNGIMQTGWQKESGRWTYYYPTGEQAFDWVKIHDKWYYLHFGDMVTGTQIINEHMYFFDNNGVWKGNITGWVYTSTNQDYSNRWYYVHSDLKVHIGWLQLGENWYYMDGLGRMVTTPLRIDKHVHLFDKNGVWQGIPFTGWKQENGKWYYYDDYGTMYVNNWLNYQGKRYYFDENGIMAAGGWHRFYNNYWGYFASDGAAHTGWLQLDGKWYHFDIYGKMQVGDILINNKVYVFDSNGVMQTGWFDYRNSRYYLGSDGAAHVGWLQLNGKWYAFNNLGRMITGWGSDGVYYYYFNSDGTMVTGWKTIDGKSYHFDSNGRCTNR